VHHIEVRWSGFMRFGAAWPRVGGKVPERALPRYDGEWLKV
jgi:hypothetical protein